MAPSGIASLKIIVGGLILYLVAIAIISFYGWKKTGSTPDDYYLGGRSLGVLVLTGTMLATYFSTFAFLGGPGFWYSNGASFLNFAFWNITGAFLVWIVGSRFWLLGQRFDHITPSDMLAGFYEKDHSVRILAAIIGITALIPYATIQLTGVGKALVGLTGGEAPFWLGVVVLTAMVAGYIVVGGLRAVAWTDVLQGFVFLVFLVVSAALTINWAGGLTAGFGSALQVDPSQWTYAVSPAEQGSWLDLTLIWVVGWVFLPHLWQRMFMARDPRVLAQSAFLSGTLSLWIITFMGLLIGGIGSGLIPTLPAGQSADAIVPVLFAEFFPAGGVLLVVAAYAAAMSTMGSQILTSSSLFVRDIAKKPFRPEMDERTESWIGRVFIVVFAAIVLVLALSPVGRTALIPLASDGVALAVLFVPPVVGLFYWEEASTNGARWSLAVGYVFMQLTIWTPVGDYLLYFDSAIWGLIVASVVYYGVSKVSDPVPEETQREYREVLQDGMRIPESVRPEIADPADD
ncbi:hypothetical protein BRC86_12465 [Halobacteriales archaeon QS_3_64_16]|nr:MAG: hypothetical protein BRC86_12465 [Halobacteriales archaeon QS_3_64_16]